jgi:ubiquinone/menaquinone biosynthesis C-methylase UbiE
MSVDPYRGRARETTAYFSQLTKLYERYRPSYPREAIEAIVNELPHGATVADVGCGTGIASRLLAEAGCGVIGIEPDDAMRGAAQALAAKHEHAEAIRFQPGTGERTGLDEASVDAVVCAQSFHWFDAAQALEEFARVLRPNGLLALMWNKVTKGNAFSVGYRAVMNEAGELARQRGRLLRRNNGTAVLHSMLFTNVRDRRFANEQPLDLDGVLGRARSASYFPAEGPERERLEGALRDLFQRTSVGDESPVTLEYETQLILARKA